MNCSRQINTHPFPPAMTRDDPGFKLAVVLPVFNDWQCLSTLLAHVDAQLSREVTSMHVVAVDDCSTEPIPPNLFSSAFNCITSIEHLRLRRSLGHQRAIAIGLSHLFEKHACDAVLVMDADGEDRPEDAVRVVP